MIDQKMEWTSLPLIAGAEYNSYLNQHEDDCLEGTRTELLKQIADWAVSPHGKCIFWLNGMAGTGKSTISRTIARSLQEHKLLAASFFFKTGEGDLGNAKKLFPSIARQLVLRYPELMPGLQEIIQDDPSISTKSLKEQFDKLILQPLVGLSSSDRKSRAAVIVIDALDECEIDNDIRIILRLIPQLRHVEAVNLRIFLTSRPELVIRLGFSEIENHDYQDLILHEVPETVTARDISIFFNHRFLKIRKERSLPAYWPVSTDFQDLVALSVPLFIFAATVCRTFEDHQWDPVDSLNEILAHRSEGSQLDGTYLPVFDRILRNQSDKRKKQLILEYREVIGTIVMLENPLPVSSLSRLTSLSERLIRLRLESLHSVIRVPGDRYSPVRVFHLSFREFLLDPATRDKSQIWIDQKEMHQKLAVQCLLVCGTLKRNICELSSQGTQCIEIDPQKIKDHISLELQYACRFWAQHLVQSEDPGSLIEHALSFLQKHFLHWTEAMSLLGLASEVVKVIDLLQTSIRVSFQ